MALTALAATLAVAGALTARAHAYEGGMQWVTIVCGAEISVPSLGQTFRGILDVRGLRMPGSGMTRVGAPVYYVNETLNNQSFPGVGGGYALFDLDPDDPRAWWDVQVGFPRSSPVAPDINRQTFSLQGALNGVFTGKTFAIRQDGLFGRTDAAMALTNCQVRS